MDSDSEEALSEIKSGFDKAQTIRKRGNYYSRLSSTFMMLGFFSFFVVAVFSAVTEWLMPSQNTLTILAFAMILINYETKDYFNEKYKSEAQTTQDYIEHRTKQIEELSEIHFANNLYDLALRIKDMTEQDTYTDANAQPYSAGGEAAKETV